MDIFDGLLFNFVAPNAVPSLLGLTIGSPEAKAATLYWTGLITALLLIGWAIGGIGFGKICDRIGRSRTLLLTMLPYSIGTFACAFAPTMGSLNVCQLLASLGIGGEWAAGAPMGLFLATAVNSLIAGQWLAGQPETPWRFVFLSGLLPAAVAFGVRSLVHEGKRWQQISTFSAAPRLRELFSPAYRRSTASVFEMALVALVEHWKTTITSSFNIGGLIGTLLTVPIAQVLGRRWMFGLYFLLSAAAMLLGLGSHLPADLAAWSWLYFAIGVSVFGIFSSFTFYLLELFPTRLRATGSGFCYNAGRLLTAAGPLLAGTIAARKADSLSGAFEALRLVGFVPLIGILLLPLVIETRGRALLD